MINALSYFNAGSGVVTLCGSTKYFEECMECNRILTFKNWIVLMCGSWGHSYHKDRESSGVDYSKVKLLHYYKIKMSNCIVVVSDESNYIGDSTKAEIEFTKYYGLPIFYFNGKEFSGYSDTYPVDRFYYTDSLIEEFSKTHSFRFLVMLFILLCIINVINHYYVYKQ